MDFKAALQKILDKLKNKSTPLTLHIAGGSASGKSYFASLLSSKLGKNYIILMQDDYFKGKTYMERQRKRGIILNFDQPQVVNLPLLKKHLTELLKGQPINKPIHNFKLAESLESEVINPKKIIIVDGLYALRHPLYKLAHLKIFVRSSFQSRLIRRMLRDLSSRSGWFKTPVAIYNYFIKVVEPMHKKYVESTAKLSDIIIENEFNPLELANYDIKKLQKKFKTSKDKKIFNSVLRI